jgi:gliding motility-associated-like protein
LIFLSSSIIAQEICDNGIDDDNDNLIDLNDPDCECEGFSSTNNAPSLIPNPSFEVMDCCPNSYSQLNCAQSWTQATTATSDYQNTQCFTMPAVTLPPPDGNGFVGAIFSEGWQEYVGACLSQPMVAGSEYELNMQIHATLITGQGGACGAPNFPAIDITIFGNPSCNELPYTTTGCPGGNWQAMGSVNYNPSNIWAPISITFTPAVNISAVMIGSPCTLPGGYSAASCYPYFVFDNLLLNETSFFATVGIDQIGTWCNDDIVLQAIADTTGGVWQWYKEGIALVGQTEANLSVSALSIGAGTYTATYTIGNNCEWLDHIVSLPDYPAANAAANDECFPTAISFNDLSTVASGGITSWEWNFGDSNTSNVQNPIHSYASDGTYNVELITVSDINCPDTFLTTVTVQPQPDVQFTVVEGCLGTASVFTDESSINAPGTITGFQWDFGDAITSNLENPTHQYFNSGAYNIDLTVTSADGCTNNVITPINVYPPPTINLSVQDDCAEEVFAFTNNSSIPIGSIDIIDWEMGDGTPYASMSVNHVYANAATYSVTLSMISDQGCPSDTAFQVVAFPNPVAAFSLTDACLNDVNIFTDLSTISGSNIIDWEWDFGDFVGAEVIQNPSYTYGTTGQFSVTLIPTTLDGCTDTVTEIANVYDLPVSAFQFTDACLNTDFQFTDQSNIPSGSINNWNWDFGDINQSNLQNPNHQYLANGSFDVTLIVSSGQFCADTSMQSVTVYPLPAADFTTTDVCSGFDMQYTDNSAISSGTIDTYQWYFGDGGLSNETNSTHAYSVGGTYTASLVIGSNLGCEDSVAIDVLVYPDPVSEFSATNVCLNNPNLFADESTVFGSNINEWYWDMGDGVGIEQVQNPNYTYSSDGFYNVMFIPITQEGCRDTILHTIYVHPLPIADFTFTNVCEDESAQFNDLSAVIPGTIQDWDWSFGNGVTSNNQLPAPQFYPLDSLYEVSLLITTDSGCTDLITDQIEIYSVPIANFSFDSVCFPLPIHFTNLSDQNGTSPISNYAWSFTDGQLSNLPSPTINFADFGAYGASLLITNQAGCKDEIEIGNALVHPLPVADYTSNFSNCIEDSTWFADASNVELLSDDSLVAWNYTLADSNFIFSPNGNHLYLEPNIYQVQLHVATNHGCQDSILQQIEVYPRPLISWNLSPREGCVPHEVHFTDNSSIPQPYSLNQWEWNLGFDSTSIAAIPNPTFVYYPDNIAPLDSVVYDIGLAVTSLKGCSSSLFLTDQVVVHPNPEAFFRTDPIEVTSITEPLFKFLDLSSENVISWEWEFGDGSGSTLQHSSHEYSDTGRFHIDLWVETVYGCADHIDYEVIINPTFTFYIPNAFTPNSDGVNESFLGYGTGYLDYSMGIYDRWGELLYFTNNPKLGWDGRFKGNPCEQGEYVYKFHVIDWANFVHDYVGGFTLVK